MHRPLPFGAVEEQDYQTTVDMLDTLSQVEDSAYKLCGDAHQLRYRIAAYQVRMEKANQAAA